MLVGIAWIAIAWVILKFVVGIFYAILLPVEAGRWYLKEKVNDVLDKWF